MPTHVVQVNVSVLTYQRNADLAELVPLLAEEIAGLSGEGFAGLDVQVLVVDNDPAGGAEDVVRRLAEEHPVRYVLESTPGIAAARNRALDEVAPDGVVVFIDDDERPVRGWLARMLSTWQQHRSAGVGGPVQARLTDDVDPWILAGGFFERGFHASFTDGTPVQVAPTGNILLDMSRINAHGLRFDTGLGLAGGEDTLFTRQLIGHGEQIIWCSDAVVLDPVPPSRLTRRWVVRRVFFVANASIRASIRLAGPRLASVPVRLRYGGTGAARILLGLAQLGAGVVGLDQRLRARGVRRATRGAGALTAVLGFGFEEYRR